MYEGRLTFSTDCTAEEYRWWTQSGGDGEIYGWKKTRIWHHRIGEAATFSPNLPLRLAAVGCSLH